MEPTNIKAKLLQYAGWHTYAHKMEIVFEEKVELNVGDKLVLKGFLQVGDYLQYELSLERADNGEKSS